MYRSSCTCPCLCIEVVVLLHVYVYVCTGSRQAIFSYDFDPIIFRVENLDQMFYFNNWCIWSFIVDLDTYVRYVMVYTSNIINPTKLYTRGAQPLSTKETYVNINQARESPVLYSVNKPITYQFERIAKIISIWNMNCFSSYLK